MTTRRYRCYACQKPSGEYGVDFDTDAAEPTCPHCKCGGLQEAGGCLEPVVMVHFLPPVDHPDPRVRLTRSTNTLACRSDVSVIGSGFRGTNEPRAVTCPDCQRTDAYKTASYAAGYHPAYQPPPKQSRPADAEGLAPGEGGTLPGQFKAADVGGEGVSRG